MAESSKELDLYVFQRLPFFTPFYLESERAWLVMYPNEFEAETERFRLYEEAKEFCKEHRKDWDRISGHSLSGRIANWIDLHLGRSGKLPKPADELTDDEVEIFKLAASHCGFLIFLREWLLDNPTFAGQTVMTSDLLSEDSARLPTSTDGRETR